MEFIAGLIVGFVAGMFSWLALAIWLKARHAASETPSKYNGSGFGSSLDRLHETPSHAA